MITHPLSRPRAAVSAPLVLFLVALAAAAPKTLYTCGMHPDIVRDEPGLCPKCQMELVPMEPDRARIILEARGETESTDSNDRTGGPSIRIDPVTEQNMGMRYDTVRLGPLVRTIRTVGTVDYNEQGLGTVTTKVNGWVEAVRVNETGMQVHAGDPLFDFYAPELYSAQEEFLQAARDALREGSGTGDLARRRFESAGDRLRLFDIAEEQIEDLLREGVVRKTLSIAARQTGIVTEKMVVQGDYLQAGQPAYKIADLSNVWVIGRVFETDLPYIKLGQEAQMELDYLPGRIYRGRVTYIYPYLKPGTREIPVRMEFHNPGYDLKPGMYATVTIQGILADQAVLAPVSAVIDTGERQIVFIRREPGKFAARRVVTGARGRDDELQILSGLTPGEIVVVSGQFLLDSESRLREATLKMLGLGEQEHTSHPMPVEFGSSLSTDQTGDEPLRYVCPMPSHSGILYDQPGDCPLCAMKLVPTHPWHAAEATVENWICPMPEHLNVRADGPGKCPDCGMTLIPVTREELDRFRGAANDARTSEMLYTCAMAEHADVVHDRPGLCEKCNMALVPTSQVEHGAHSEEVWRKRHLSPAPAAAPQPEHDHAAP